MKQAPVFDGLPFGPVSLFQIGFAPSKVDISRGKSLQAVVVVPVVVTIDKGVDLLPKIACQKVVLQQDAVLKGLVPALDLALGLRVIWCAFVPETLSYQINLNCPIGAYVGQQAENARD